MRCCDSRSVVIPFNFRLKCKEDMNMNAPIIHVPLSLLPVLQYYLL